MRCQIININKMGGRVNFEYKIKIKNNNSTKWIYQGFSNPINIGDHIAQGDELFLVKEIFHSTKNKTQLYCDLL